MTGPEVGYILTQVIHNRGRHPSNWCYQNSPRGGGGLMTLAGDPTFLAVIRITLAAFIVPKVTVATSAYWVPCDGVWFQRLIAQIWLRGVYEESMTSLFMTKVVRHEVQNTVVLVVSALLCIAWPVSPLFHPSPDSNTERCSSCQPLLCLLCVRSSSTKSVWYLPLPCSDELTITVSVPAVLLEFLPTAFSVTGSGASPYP